MNKNSLPVIQSLWIGDTLSEMERLCISSFIRNGHAFHLYTYKEIKNAPPGTVIKDAGEIVSPDKIFKYKDRDTYAGFSNIFRYKLILEKGNYWVDSDVICLKPFDFTDEYVFSGAISWKPSDPFKTTLHVQSCVIKTPPGSEIMKYCYDVSTGKNNQEIVWGEIGPNLLESAVFKFGLTKFVHRYGTFSPLNWSDWDKFVSASPIATWKEQAKFALYRSKAVHLYNEMWRLNKVNKNAGFPKTCLYEQLKKQYLYYSN